MVARRDVHWLPLFEPETGPRIEFVDIDGQRLRVAVSPVADGQVPLLVFNGIGVSFEIFRRFVRHLEGHPVILFDAPGVGGSRMPSWPYRMWNLASLTRRLLDRYRIDNVDVLGVSWGGAAAQQFAIQYSTSCRRLILAATGAGGFMVPGSVRALMHMVHPGQYFDPMYMLKFGAEIFGGLVADDPKLIGEHARYMQVSDPISYYYQVYALIGWNSLFWLPFLRQRTLVMAGTRDPLVPLLNAQILSLLIPHARLHALNDGHLFMATSAKESADVARRFLAESD